MGRKANLKRVRRENQLSGQSLTQKQPANLIFSEKTKKIIQISLLLLILIIGIRMRVSYFETVRRSPDERVYTNQANKIFNKGIKGTKILISEYHLDKALWFYPPPTRIGHNYLLAMVMKISGNRTEMAGVYLSAIASILTLLLLIMAGIRIFNPWVAIIALFGLAVSPMDLIIARRCWQEALLGFVGMLYFYLCAELMNKPKRIFLFLPIIITGCYSMLIKESGIVVFGLGMLCVFLSMVFKEKSLLGAIASAISGVLALILTFFILVKVSGGISSWLSVMKNVKTAMPLNTYAIEFQTGPWYSFLQGLWMVTPLFTIAAIGGVIYAFLNGIKKNTVIFSFGMILVLFIAATTLTPYCKNLRYISPIFCLFYLMGGYAIWGAVKFLHEKAKILSLPVVVSLLSLALVAGAFFEYRFFKKIISKENILVDLSVNGVILIYKDKLR